MPIYSRIDENNIVVDTIIATQDVIDSNAIPGVWVLSCPDDDYKAPPVKKQYGGIGYSWSPILKEFIPPKSHPSATLDEVTMSWVNP